MKLIINLSISVDYYNNKYILVGNVKTISDEQEKSISPDLSKSIRDSKSIHM